MKIPNNHYFVNHTMSTLYQNYLLWPGGLGLAWGPAVSPDTHTSLQGKFNGHFEI